MYKRQAEGFDIGIRGGIVRDSSLVARRICALPLVLVASPDYLARRGVPRTIEDLATHDCVTIRFVSGAMPVWQFKSGAAAVSYTHLDVYKRQTLNCAALMAR